MEIVDIKNLATKLADELDDVSVEILKIKIEDAEERLKEIENEKGTSKAKDNFWSAYNELLEEEAKLKLLVAIKPLLLES